MSGDRGALAFAEQLLNTLDQGRFVATYKYAVILALLDLCLEGSSRSGAPPSSVTTLQLAAKVAELYWPHTRPFRGKRVLQQNTGKQAGILNAVQRFRNACGAEATGSLTRARTAQPEAYLAMIDDVEWTLVHMPLPKLQRIGIRVVPFLYEIAWDDQVRKREWRSADSDNVIRFVGGAAGHLVRLTTLIRPIVMREWTAHVARMNADLIKDPELEEFLFGASRISTKALRTPLRELHDDRCFYCEGRLKSSWEVDHFIPWSRHPDNGIENLVPSHRGCNASKRDFLAASSHVGHWVSRAQRNESDLAQIAASRSWDRDPERSLGVARAIYLRLPDGAPLWQGGSEFSPAEPASLRAILAAA